MLEVRIQNAGFKEGETVLSDVNFSVKSGEVLAIVGESGIGKSTLLKTIAGLIPVFDGEILLDGRSIKKAKHALIAGDDNITLVNQSFNEDLYFTVEENIRSSMLHLTKDDQNAFIEELLKTLSLVSKKDIHARYLSGGEKQRVSLACALAKEPDVLLLDEPFAHIDVYLRKRIGNYLRNLVKDKKIALIWVSHEGEEALSWGDHILIASRESWLGKFTPEQVYFDLKDKPYAHYFGEVNQIQLKGEKYFFRPWFFKKSGDEESKIEINYQSHALRNGYYANYFLTKDNEQIVLFSLSIMNDCKAIYV
jgi:ABC-type multidrug transport system ATPase subunit